MSVMKKPILLVATLLLSFAYVYAQTITLSSKTVNVQGPNADEKSAVSAITNNSTDSTDNVFSWHVISFNKQMGWDIDFCDPYECFSKINSSSTEEFTLNKGASGIMKGDFYFNNVNGNGSVTVVIKSKKNPTTNADTLTLNATAWVTAVNEVSKTKTVSFYPNPVKDQLTLKFPVKEGITVEIYNVLGMRVKTFVHSNATTSVNIGDLQNGVYFIRFTENGKLYTKQFTKAE
jgi:hypothetical protein